MKMEVIELSAEESSAVSSENDSDLESDSDSESESESSSTKVDLSAPFNPLAKKIRGQKKHQSRKKTVVSSKGSSPDSIGKKERKPRESAESIKQSRREAFASQVAYLVQHKARLYQTSLEFLKQHQDANYDQVSNDVRLRLGRLYYSVFNQIQQESSLEESPEGFVAQVHTLKEKVNSILSQLKAQLSGYDDQSILRFLLNDWEHKFYDDMSKAQYTLSNKQYLTTHKILKSIYDRIINVNKETGQGQVVLLQVEKFKEWVERIREVTNRPDPVLIAEKTMALILSLSEEVNRLVDRHHQAKVLVCNAKRVVEFENQVKQIVSGIHADESCIEKVVSIQV